MGLGGWLDRVEGVATTATIPSMRILESEVAADQIFGVIDIETGQIGHILSTNDRLPTITLHDLFVPCDRLIRCLESQRIGQRSTAARSHIQPKNSVGQPPLLGKAMNLSLSSAGQNNHGCFEILRKRDV